MITHAIFDLDGVLLDTERLSIEGTTTMLQKCGISVPRDYGYKIAGLNGPSLVTRLKMDFNLSHVSGETLLKLYRQEFTNAIERRGVSTINGAIELTAGMRAMGMGIGIASNSSRKFFKLKTKEYQGWFRMFDTIVLADDPRKPKPKPAPDLYLLAAADMHAKPENCLVFEDSDVGVQAAIAAGMQVIKINT